MKKRYQIVAIMLSVSMLIGACGVQEKQTPEKGNPDTKRQTGQEEVKVPEYQAKLDMIQPSAYRDADGLKLEKGAFISVIGKGDNGQFWKAVEAGAMQAADDINAMLGYTGKDKVKVTYSGPSEENNVDEQVNILDEELARYPVAVSISIVDTQACGVQFDLAGQGDIPIVAFDSSSDYPGLDAMVATDNQESARQAADHMAKLLGDSGDVMVFVPDSSSQVAEEREEGFVQRIQEMHPGISVVRTYHMDQMEELQEEMVTEGATEKTADEITEEEVMDYLISRYPNVKGIYAANTDAVKFALQVKERGKLSAHVIGYDCDTEELKGLENGEIDELILQNPFGMGYAAVIAAARASLSLGNEAFVNTGFVWVTRENMNEDSVKELLY